MKNETAHPFISIIIPVYNVISYVKEAVDSVLNQDVDSVEIIIVDDGSTDGSGELVDELYSNLSIVRILHTTNQGLGQARNNGLKIARGTFVYFFDSDDLLCNDLLRGFYKAWSASKDIEVFCFSALAFWDEGESDIIGLPNYNRVENTVYRNGIEAFNDMSNRNTFFPNAWLYVFLRKISFENEILFKPIIHEDEEFTPRLFFKSKKIYVTNKVYFKRRMRKGSIMRSSRTEANIIGYLMSISALEKLLSLSHDDLTRKTLINRININLIKIIEIKNTERLELDSIISKKISSCIYKHATFKTQLISKLDFLYFFLKKSKAILLRS